jgi:hypothetical protein
MIIFAQFTYVIAMKWYQLHSKNTTTTHYQSLDLLSSGTYSAAACRSTSSGVTHPLPIANTLACSTDTPLNPSLTTGPRW